MKSALVLLAALAMLAVGCQTSERLVTFPTQTVAEVKAPLDVPALEKRFPGQDGVYLQRDTSFEHVTSDGWPVGITWTFFETQTRSYVVFNPDAKWLSTFEVQVSPGSELERVALEIRGTDGKSHQFGAGDLKQEQDSKGLVTYKLAYPDVRKGCVITEAYVIKKTNCWAAPPLHHEVPLQFSIPCLQASYRFLYPNWWATKVKALGQGRALPVEVKKEEQAKKTIMTYTAKDIPAVEKEPFSPFFKEVSNYAEIMVTQLSLGKAYYAAPLTWDAYAKEFKGYVMDKNPIFSQRVDRATVEATQSCKTDRERLEALVGWIQANMEIGATKGNFADVLAAKRGSVYQLTGLAQSMLRKAGINSRFLLIHSAEDGYFDKDFISSEELYIPALMADLGGRSYVVLPYAKNLPVDIIPERFQGQTALAIEPSGAAQLITVPTGNLATNEVSEDYALTFSEDGKVRVTEEKTFQGPNAYSVRRSLADLNREETEKLLKGLLTYTEGKVEFTKYEFVDQSDYKKPLKVHLEYVIDNLVTLTPEEVLFNTGGLFAPASRLKTKVAPKDRQNPVRIYYDEASRKNILLTFPASWRLSRVPQDFRLENRFGSISGSYKSGPRKLQVQQALTLKKSFEPKERIEDLLELTGNHSKLYVPTLVFKVKG
ncbi:transglutaminase domain-containing protein [Geothrix terrae]|uniref:transglutaminase domain-containing protein n=1 Tax=Geothrix terrae TaxID=2922720 RepID=UPI001FACFE93|nr:transglutaminase domain-containing protein [Geothrix terrae]